MVTIFPGVVDLSRANIQIDLFNGQMVNERCTVRLIASDPKTPYGFCERLPASLAA